LRRTTAPEPIRRVISLVPRPDPERDPYDVITLLDEERGGDRGVNSATHSDDDSIHHQLAHSTFADR
jgi:hypothetical protein